MKSKFLSFLFLFTSLIVFAQSGSLGSSDANPNSQYLGTTAGIYILSSDSNIKIKRIFLFDDFQNQAIILDKSNKKYKINNFNIDLINKTFVSQTKSDSLFTFTNILKAYVNTREFINIDNNLEEIIVKGGRINFSINHFSKKKEKELDKMNGSILNPERYVAKREYIFKNTKANIIYKSSRLKKKKIIKLLDKKDRDEMINYAKQNILSFTRINDLQQILNYYNSI